MQTVERSIGAGDVGNEMMIEALGRRTFTKRPVPVFLLVNRFTSYNFHLTSDLLSFSTFFFFFFSNRDCHYFVP